MEITLRPEDEAIIRRRLQSGAFASIDDVIHRALQSLDIEEAWFQANKEAIHNKIGRGLAEIDRGEGLSGEASRAKLQEKKTGWLERSR